jgi:hypothetical protein
MLDYKDHNKITIIQDIIININNGILFIYAGWAPYTYKLDLLIKSIQNSDIKVYVIDIENEIIYDFLKDNNLIGKYEIGGWGEIFWIKNGEVLIYWGKEFDQIKLTEYNRMIIK